MNTRHKKNLQKEKDCKRQNRKRTRQNAIDSTPRSEDDTLTEAAEPALPLAVDERARGRLAQHSPDHFDEDTEPLAKKSRRDQKSDVRNTEEFLRWTANALNSEALLDEQHADVNDAGDIVLPLLVHLKDVRPDCVFALELPVKQHEVRAGDSRQRSDPNQKGKLKTAHVYGITVKDLRDAVTAERESVDHHCVFKHDADEPCTNTFIATSVERFDGERFFQARSLSLTLVALAAAFKKNVEDAFPAATRTLDRHVNRVIPLEYIAPFFAMLNVVSRRTIGDFFVLNNMQMTLWTASDHLCDELIPLTANKDTPKDVIDSKSELIKLYRKSARQIFSVCMRVLALHMLSAGANVRREKSGKNKSSDVESSSLSQDK